MDDKTFGKPIFPIKISHDKPIFSDRVIKSIRTGESLPIDDDPITITDSLYKIRQANEIEHKRHLHIYDGLIYRLLKAKSPDKWLLGQTSYKQIMESCDYLSFKIKSGWVEALEIAKNGGDSLAVEKFFNNDSVVKEWYDLVQNLIKGDFTKYLAGLAFSAPIFQVCENGSINLLLGKGSAAKQANYGMHVAPAGMFEYSPGDGQLDELTIPNFQTIVAKEMAEETLIGENYSSVVDKYKRFFFVMESGMSLTGDPFRAEIVRMLFDKDIIENWNQIWVNNPPPSKTPLIKILNLNPNIHKSFWIVDCFILRPEIIIPLYITETITAVLNWEFEAASLEIKNFRNWDNVLDYLNEHSNAWCAPGLASLYLGSKYFFDNHDKFMKELFPK
jgi:hypothetical protein